MNVDVKFGVFERICVGFSIFARMLVNLRACVYTWENKGNACAYVAAAAIGPSRLWNLAIVAQTD